MLLASHHKNFSSTPFEYFHNNQLVMCIPNIHRVNFNVINPYFAKVETTAVLDQVLQCINTWPACIFNKSPWFEPTSDIAPNCWRSRKSLLGAICKDCRDRNGVPLSSITMFPVKAWTCTLKVPVSIEPSADGQVTFCQKIGPAIFVDVLTTKRQEVSRFSCFRLKSSFRVWHGSWDAIMKHT